MVLDKAAATGRQNQKRGYQSPAATGRHAENLGFYWACEKNDRSGLNREDNFRMPYSRSFYNNFQSGGQWPPLVE
jgi:hypothetical protein